MPTYEYKCPDCGHRKEIIHKMDEEFIYYCFECLNPEKDASKLVKVISGGLGVHFKGSGFYETDYKRK